MKDTTPEHWEDKENDEEISEEEHAFMGEIEEQFSEIWKEVKEESKDWSKKELAQRMFVLGAMLLKKNIDEQMKETSELAKNDPEEFRKIMEEHGEKDDLWEEGAFIETMGTESETKMRTFNLKHNEEMDFNCRKCDALMSAHNKDWHDGLCDGCFDKEVHKK